MNKIALVVSLLTTAVLATYPAHHHLYAGPFDRLLSPREAHLRLLGRGPRDLEIRQSCGTGEVACGSGCIPSDAVCCPDGDYCNAGQICWVPDSGCCNPGDIVCGSGCMPPGSACCDTDGHYCRAGDQCVLTSGGSSACCAVSEVCDGQVGITTFQAGTTIASGPPASSTVVSTTPV